jgi:hypothetical protein
LTAGSGTTVALVGHASGSPALSVGVYSDEIIANDGPLRMRFINASPGTPLLQLSTGSFMLATVAPLFPAVPFGQFGAALEADALVPAVDEDGYKFVPNLQSTPLSMQIPGSTTDMLVTLPVSTISGIPVTVVALGGTSADSPVFLYECLDSGGGTGAVAACHLLPPDPSAP